MEDTMDTLTLSQTDTRRLEKLANEAGRSPNEVLKHVLREAPIRNAMLPIRTWVFGRSAEL